LKHTPQQDFGETLGLSSGRRLSRVAAGNELAGWFNKMTSASIKTDIKELTKDQFVSWLEGHGLKPYRAMQVLKWIYYRQADTFNIMTDVGIEIRKLLSSHFTIDRLEKARISF